MNSESRAYFERRERTERAAAKQAASPQARGIHQELAQRYSTLARAGASFAQAEMHD
jgi:hypothetical protein